MTDEADITHAAPGRVGRADTPAGGPTARPELIPALEALLIVAEAGQTTAALAAVLGRAPADVAAALTSISQDHDTAGHGMRLRETGSGWQWFAAPEYADLVRRAMTEQRPARLSQAALETLAVVAYRQPVSRSTISAIRGVGVDAVLRTLLGRGLVEERGSDPAHGAVLYGTTDEFLDVLGLKHLSQLPPIAERLPEVENVLGSAALTSI